MADLKIETRREKDWPVIDLTGEVDSYNSPRLRETMVSLIDAGNPRLVINMTGVDYIDSTGLGTLVSGLKRVSEKGGEIRIICPNPAILKVFTITGLVRVFPIFDTEEPALS